MRGQLSWLEHLPYKQGVSGSNPLLRTTRHIQQITQTVCCWFKSNYLAFGYRTMGSSTEIICLVLQGRSQVVRHQTLTLTSAGSNPAAPARSEVIRTKIVCKSSRTVGSRIRRVHLLKSSPQSSWVEFWAQPHYWRFAVNRTENRVFICVNRLMAQGTDLYYWMLVQIQLGAPYPMSRSEALALTKVMLKVKHLLVRWRFGLSG